VTGSTGDGVGDDDRTTRDANSEVGDRATAGAEATAYDGDGAGGEADGAEY
jgi:hypothetical protein